MDYSGERFIPHQADLFDEISVEHAQRYRAIRNLVQGKIVLDAGSGEGYGAHLLAESAARVVGIDISSEAVANARATYQRANLEYQEGSIDALPFKDGSFEIVVSFEVIEHLEEGLQAAFMREVGRVLRKDGFLVISTPNKAVYTDSANHHNRFHKKEFYIDEFESFLRGTFPHIAMFGQSWFVSSVLDRPSSRTLVHLRPSEQIAVSPKYVVAVCGFSDSVDRVDFSSVIVDQRGRFEAMGTRILALQNEVEAKNAWALSLQRDILQLGKAVDHFKAEPKVLEARLSEAHQHIASLDQHISFLDRHIATLNEQVAAQNAAISSLNSQNEFLSRSLRDRETELASIKQSDFWRLATRYWQARDLVLPPGSRRRLFLKGAFRFLKAGLQFVKRLAHGGLPALFFARRAAAGQSGSDAAGEAGFQAELLEFMSPDQPKVSIVIPAFNQWIRTYRCLRSIEQNMAGVPCEILLADDGSTDGTVRAGEILSGVKILRDGTNRGFLKNCNWAAAQAAGKYLYLLNNDTELRPGAIQALVSLLDQDPSVGMVGSKLVYPDGRLQEAGGIIWADATGWNFGRGQDPSLPAFNYVKEADYVSGASLMIRSDLWNAIGGFDERFAPAYCEDSDLAFEVRKRGYRVLYQPQSVVVHFEGASHGTDLLQKTKANQIRNTDILKLKWARELTQQLPNGKDVFRARDRSAGRKVILVIDHYIPQFDKDAGSRTIWSFIQVFLKMGMSVKFLGDNFFAHQPYTDIHQQAGVEVLTGPWFADHWKEWLGENGGGIDFVFLSRPHIAPKYLQPVRTLTNARIFYYVHDLHYLRDLKSAELVKDSSLKARAEREKVKEQKLMSQMDVIFSCSDTEAELIHELCPDTEVLYVPPYSVDVDLGWEFRAETRAGLLFVGGFSHPPNVDGILWFVREVWPDVKRQLPGVVFSIVGSSPPPEVLALEAEDVKVLGFVSDESLRELYRVSRLVVIPLRYGAGVKGKTVEAMAHGVPLVSTECGVEGMPGIEEILDAIQYRSSLAEGIVGLYPDASRLREISQRERAYVERLFTAEKIQEAFALATADR